MVAKLHLQVAIDGSGSRVEFRPAKAAAVDYTAMPTEVDCLLYAHHFGLPRQALMTAGQRPYQRSRNQAASSAESCSPDRIFHHPSSNLVPQIVSRQESSCKY